VELLLSANRKGLHPLDWQLFWNAVLGGQWMWDLTNSRSRFWRVWCPCTHYLEYRCPPRRLTDGESSFRVRNNRGLSKLVSLNGNLSHH